MTEERYTGDLEMLPLSRLLLDWDNPRLRPDERLDEDLDPGSDVAQVQLAMTMNKRYHPLAIAESIAEHEFFLSEPLIAVPHDEDRFRVIEGNRRLTALRGLTDHELREEFASENRGWRDLPVYDEVPAGYPVLVVADEGVVASLLGFRHISGIEPWAAHAQARYISSLVENGKSIDEVSELVGKSRTVVASMYRNIDILSQAESMFGIDVSRATRSFGVFNNAMSRQGIREFIAAPAPREVDPNTYPLPNDRAPQLQELLVFMFGDDDGKGRVVSDSRRLGDLSKILVDNEGKALEILRSSGDLDLALAFLNTLDERLSRAIGTCMRSLSSLSVSDVNAAGVSLETRERWNELVRRVLELDAAGGGN